MENSYAKAYTEVLEVLKYIPKEEYSKIPNDKIEFFKAHMDKDYTFFINPEIDLAEQNISIKANAVLVDLYLEFFATEEQKVMIEKKLEQNQLEEETEKRERYKPNDLFKKIKILKSKRLKHQKRRIHW